MPLQNFVPILTGFKERHPLPDKQSSGGCLHTNLSTFLDVLALLTGRLRSYSIPPLPKRTVLDRATANFGISSVTTIAAFLHDGFQRSGPNALNADKLLLFLELKFTLWSCDQGYLGSSVETIPTALAEYVFVYVQYHS